MAEAILQLEQVTKRFERTLAADRLSLTVHRGEFFTFLGPSGSGKSTILRMIAGLEAVLVEVIYRGTNVDHVLELPDGQRLVATSTQREAEGAGQPVACGFDAGDVILLED